MRLAKYNTTELIPGVLPLSLSASGTLSAVPHNSQEGAEDSIAVHGLMQWALSHFTLDSHIC